MNAYSITSDCKGCTLCARNCPVHAISGARKEQHVIDENACVRCGLCGRLCASGAVRDELGNPVARVPKKEWPHPVVDVQECAGCSLCIVNCPAGCLKLSEPVAWGDTHTYAQVTDVESCIGCGICASTCPVDAIVMVGPTTKEEAR